MIRNYRQKYIPGNFIKLPQVPLLELSSWKPTPSESEPLEQSNSKNNPHNGQKMFLSLIPASREQVTLKRAIKDKCIIFYFKKEISRKKVKGNHKETGYFTLKGVYKSDRKLSSSLQKQALPGMVLPRISLFVFHKTSFLKK